MIRYASLALVAFLSTPSAFALEAFSDPVVSVLDGDTIEVLHDQHPERIRLRRIDCPEKGQAYGKRAKQAVSELVFGMDDETRCVRTFMCEIPVCAPHSSLSCDRSLSSIRRIYGRIQLFTTH
jgi:hypothetical protein